MEKEQQKDVLIVVMVISMVVNQAVFAKRYIL